MDWCIQAIKISKMINPFPCRLYSYQMWPLTAHWSSLHTTGYFPFCCNLFFPDRKQPRVHVTRPVCPKSCLLVVTVTCHLFLTILSNCQWPWLITTTFTLRIAMTDDQNTTYSKSYSKICLKTKPFLYKLLSKTLQRRRHGFFLGWGHIKVSWSLNYFDEDILMI